MSSRKQDEVSGLSSDTMSAGVFTLDFSTSRIVTNKLLFFMHYPRVVVQHKWSKTQGKYALSLQKSSGLM